MQLLSEWTSGFFNAKWALFQLYMMLALYKTNMLRWTSILLFHWSNSLQVHMSLHSDTLFWFWANQTLFLPLNAVCYKAEKQQITILVFGFIYLGFEPTIQGTWGEHTNYYTDDVVASFKSFIFPSDAMPLERVLCLHSTSDLGIPAPI